LSGWANVAIPTSVGCSAGAFAVSVEKGLINQGICRPWLAKRTIPSTMGRFSKRAWTPRLGSERFNPKPRRASRGTWMVPGMENKAINAIPPTMRKAVTARNWRGVILLGSPCFRNKSRQESTCSKAKMIPASRTPPMVKPVGSNARARNRMVSMTGTSTTAPKT